MIYEMRIPATRMSAADQLELAHQEVKLLSQLAIKMFH